jgi:hypothetical protein
MWLVLVLLTASVVDAATTPRVGVIEGVVVRAANGTSVSGAEVVLRAKVDGQLLPVAETTADAQGRFRFERLPSDGSAVYLPGANRGGIHYPGPTMQLTSLQPRAEVKLAVYDAAAFPSPLVVRRHTITLYPEPGVLRVTESMLIDNPSTACYVGRAAGESGEAETLQLAIPASFQQVTFASEFYGRRFSLIGGRLVTGIPWPPGQRELTFSYVLPNAERCYVWQRPLDLPSSQVQVLVRASDQPDQVTSNLAREPRKEHREVTFASGTHILSAGYVLRVELGNRAVSVMTYAPWGALAILAVLIVATSLQYA